MENCQKLENCLNLENCLSRENPKSEKMFKSQNLAKSGKKLSKSKNSTNFDTRKNRPKFLTPNAKTTFNCLRLAFTKSSIFQHFDPECHIWIETDVWSYAIGGVLSQLASEARPNRVVTKTDLGQWYLVAFFLKKIILAETRYETPDSEFLAIIEVFKIRYHYLESCKHEVFILIDHNNFCRFIDTKSLSSRQVR